MQIFTTITTITCSPCAFVLPGHFQKTSLMIWTMFVLNMNTFLATSNLKTIWIRQSWFNHRPIIQGRGCCLHVTLIIHRLLKHALVGRMPQWHIKKLYHVSTDSFIQENLQFQIMIKINNQNSQKKDSNCGVDALIQNLGKEKTANGDSGVVSFMVHTCVWFLSTMQQPMYSNNCKRREKQLETRVPVTTAISCCFCNSFCLTCSVRRWTNIPGITAAPPLSIRQGGC